MPQISVIVPVYNTEPYLSRCIESVLAQTFTDFELILVDDGSSDRSGVICDEFAVRDQRVRVIHQENCGASSARNVGTLNGGTMNRIQTLPLVSVIIPVYKVEPYFRRCVDSILGQTFTDFELILVDDGTPDNCGIICDEYAEKDSRVRVIHKENGGVSSARNTGLQIACGKYIYFCDGDDYIEKDLLMDAVQAMDGYDMVVFNIDDVDINGQCISQRSNYSIESEKWDNLEYRSRFLAWDYFSLRIGYSACCRMFRKEIIDKYKLYFPEDVIITEDVCFIICYLLHTASIRTIPGVYYHYVHYPSSTVGVQFNFFHFDTHNRISKHLYDHLNQCSDQVMIKSYFPLVYYRVMDCVILRAKNNRKLTLPSIRSILFEEIEDTTFFLEQTQALVHSKRLLFQERGFIRSLKILSEWNYYLKGDLLNLLLFNVMKFCVHLQRAIWKALKLPASLVRHGK